jgi:hypothetical protein
MPCSHNFGLAPGEFLHTRPSFMNFNYRVQFHSNAQAISGEISGSADQQHVVGPGKYKTLRMKRTSRGAVAPTNHEVAIKDSNLGIWIL